jgi:disulfide bond formation protein DsbB
MGDVRLARLIALGTPLALLGGAYLSQYLGLVACEMCWWQRYAHFAALLFAVLAFVRPPGTVFVALAGQAIAISGVIGLFHAGVEYGWWQGFTACTAPVIAQGSNPLDAIMNAPTVRCDEVQWSLLGISLAGWNFLVSVAAALAIKWLLIRSARAAA